MDAESMIGRKVRERATKKVGRVISDTTLDGGKAHLRVEFEDGTKAWFEGLQGLEIM